MPRIEAIHPGATRNHNRYVGEKLRGDALKHSGIYSWTYPYPKPICYDHDTSSVRDISGRVYNAQYITNGQNGQEAVVIIPKITNKEDIRRILDGEFLTVSISASTNSAICSICGTNLMEEEFCGHYRGEVYDGVTAEYIIGDVWFDECSWVTVPADSSAQIVDLGLTQTAEAYAQYGEDIYSLSRDPENAKIPPVTAVSEGLILRESTETPPVVPKKVQKKEGTELTFEPGKPINFAEASNEDIQAAFDKLGEKLTSLEAEKAEFATAKEAAETAKAEAEAKVTTTDEELNTVKTTLTEKETALADTEAKLAEATEKVSKLDEATAKAEELASKYHESLVDRVVDYKVLCSKVSATEKDSEKELLKARSVESLNDSLSDLMREFTGVAAASLMNSVKNPAGGVKETNNPNDITPGKESLEELDPATILKNRLLRKR